jgi:hypothetical protein
MKHPVLLLLAALVLPIAACAPRVDGAPTTERRQVDIRRVQAAAQMVATTLATAGEAALTMSRWSEAEKADIRKALDALTIANEEIQKADGNIDLRGVADSMLTVAARLVPMLGLSDDARILATTSIGIMRGLLIAIPRRDIAPAA